MQLTRLGTGVYQVASETSDRTYVVDLNNDPPTCSCTHWAIGRNRAVGAGKTIPGCKHTREVVANASEKTVDDLRALLADLYDARPTEPTLKCPSCGNATFGRRDAAIVLVEVQEHYREIVVEDDGTIVGADGPFDFKELTGVKDRPPDQFICNGCQHRWDVPHGLITRWEELERHPNYRDAT